MKMIKLRSLLQYVHSNTYNWLLRYSLEILNVVVLMLLESGKQSVLNHVLVIAHLFAFSLLSQIIFNLNHKGKISKNKLHFKFEFRTFLSVEISNHILPHCDVH